ncbi:MAG: deoxyguanosinetriphosphate triphosphohydrolase, partial [Tissierellia bacterium]|nr:deoxyguanosinetriphosphate triphosphohydrolase [Tissierellia bacterium]
KKAKYIIEEIYKYYKKDLKRLPYNHLKMYLDYDGDLNYDDDAIVSDYIAGMTDKYVLNVFNEIFMPKSWEV